MTYPSILTAIAVAMSSTASAETITFRLAGSVDTAFFEPEMLTLPVNGDVVTVEDGDDIVITMSFDADQTPIPSSVVATRKDIVGEGTISFDGESIALPELALTYDDNNQSVFNEMVFGGIPLSNADANSGFSFDILSLRRSGVVSDDAGIILADIFTASSNTAAAVDISYYRGACAQKAGGRCTSFVLFDEFTMSSSTVVNSGSLKERDLE